MERIEKIWGNTTELFRNNTTSTHYIEIDKGGYCSEHKHAQKTNVFYIIEGILEVTIWDDSGSYVTELRPEIGYVNTLHIRFGQWHKFHAVTNVKCIEVYEYLYDGEDIERRTVGGMDEN